MATKIYSTLPDVRGIPDAGKSNSVRVNIPCVGRLINIKGSVTQAGAAAPLDVLRKAVGEVRLELGTEVVRRWRFADYLAVLEVNGYLNEPGLFPYYLSEPWRATAADEERLGIQLGGRYAQAALSFDLTQPAQPLAFNFGYEYDLAPKVDLNGEPILDMLGHTVESNSLAAGDPILIPDKFEGALQRMHLVVKSNVDVTRVRVLQNNSTIFERNNTAAQPELAFQLKDMGMRIPAAYEDAQGTWKLVPIVFDNNQRLENYIANTAGLRLQPSMSGASEYRLLIEHRIAR